MSPEDTARDIDDETVGDDDLLDDDLLDDDTVDDDSVDELAGDDPIGDDIADADADADDIADDTVETDDPVATAVRRSANLPAKLHEDTSMELLVPPRRLGRVLAEARVARGMSLGDVAAALGGALDDLELLEVETGRRPVSDHELEALASLYEIETSTMVPGRSQLVVDLEEGVIRARTGEAEVDPAAHRQAVLTKYLALVYSMRATEPGSTVALRIDDLDVLADALGTDRRDIEDELHRLMQGQPEPVRKRFKLLRGRVMVPIVGVMVAATAIGTLVLVPTQDSSADEVDGTPSAATGTPPPELADLPAAPEVEIGDAVVQERAADGTPGAVTVRD